jgi:hypothetical protein
VRTQLATAFGARRLSVVRAGGPRSGPRHLTALLVAVLLVIGAAPAVDPRVALAAGPSAWTGSVDLYRDGVFSTQQTWLWCTAADVQIIRNIVHDEVDHGRAGQARYFEWMRGRNRYDLPVSAGVDPQGWEAGLRRFVDDRYRLTVSATFDGAIRLAVERIRLTGLPVGLTVADGGHAWILTGFSATADPATTDDFTVTSVRVVGPLWGLQSRNGYDMRPNTQLTLDQLRRFFTPWRYDPLPMVWDGRFVSIQPVPVRQQRPALPDPVVDRIPWNAPRAI